VRGLGAKQLKNHAVTPRKVARATVKLFKGRKGEKGSPGPTGAKGDPGPAGRDGTSIVDRTRSTSAVMTAGENFDVTDVKPDVGGAL
jgi:hypothetical protein